jgi:hypothetical protein
MRPAPGSRPGTQARLCLKPWVCSRPAHSEARARPGPGTATGGCRLCGVRVRVAVSDCRPGHTVARRSSDCGRPGRRRVRQVLPSDAWPPGRRCGRAGPLAAWQCRRHWRDRLSLHSSQSFHFQTCLYGQTSEHTQDLAVPILEVQNPERHQDRLSCTAWRIPTVFIPEREQSEARH